MSALNTPIRLPSEAALDDAAMRHLHIRDDVRFAVLSTPAEREQSYRLRATIAMNRWNVPAESFPGGMDIDEDDADALHLGGWKDGTLAATARIIPAQPGKLLPTEKHFDLIVPNRSSVLEVGRVIVTNEISDRRSTALLAMLGYCWLHADDRHLWVGPNADSVIKLYELLGARAIRLSAPRQFMGETRTPVMWSMHDFSEAFLNLANRPRRSR